MGTPGEANTPGDNPRYPVAQPAPAEAQDAEAAREGKLKAEDDLQMLESNSEANKVAIESMKTDIAQLQAANSDLKQQLAQLQAALTQAEAERTKEREVLVEEVARLVAAHSSGSSAPRKHHEDDGADQDSNPSTEVHSHDGESAVGQTSDPQESTPGKSDEASDPSSGGSGGNSLAPPEDPPPKPQKGYYHVVEKGETLNMICQAYRDQGVKVSVTQVRKANGLTERSLLKVGEKLFIPKPGT